MTTATGTSPADALGRTVAGVVTGLQAGHLARSPASSANLARLRRAVTSPPGSVPEVWEHTVGALPDELLGRGDAPSLAERAAHAAITLYAVHQQGKGEPMHVSGSAGASGSVGSAVAALRRREMRDGGSGEAVLRRFSALATSQSDAELAHHLRSLITQLREPGIPLDYARLARDLMQLQQPGRQAGVRLAWGRDLYRRHASDAPTAAPTSEETA